MELIDFLSWFFGYELFWKYRNFLLPGIAITFEVFFLSAFFAVAVGFVIALGRLALFLPLRIVAGVYVELIRSTPEYILLIWIHFVPPLILATVLVLNVNFPPFVSAVTTLSIAYSCYFAEVFRAGILAIPRGHIDAALSVGLGRARIMWRITLPQVVRLMIPDAMNLFISLFKATTLVSLIAVPDLLNRISKISVQEANPMPLYSGVAILYFIFIFLLSSSARAISERWRAKISEKAKMEVWRRVIWANIDVLAQGFLVTAQITLIAFSVGILLGLAVCLMRLYARPLKWLARVLIEYGRNTPVYVNLLWVNFVWPELFGWPNTIFQAGWTALAIQTTGYLAETFRAGIEGISRGQHDAATSVGMSRMLTLRRIILPQALLIMSPSIVNQFVIAIKTSALVSIIGVHDLMYETLRLNSKYLEPIQVLTFAALIYIVVINFFSLLSKLLADKIRVRFG